MGNFIYYEKLEDYEMKVEKAKKYDKLQNNWNKLKKWLEEEYEYYDKHGSSVHGYAMGQINRIKSKMQELEGNNE